MKLTIANKTEEPLLSRTKVEGGIVFEGATPSAAEVQKQIGSQLKVDEGLVLVQKIDTQFGKQEAGVVAVVYQDKESMKKVENIAEEEKKEEAPAEGEAAPEEKSEAKEEAPAEEKSDDAAEEKKE